MALAFFNKARSAGAKALKSAKGLGDYAAPSRAHGNYSMVNAVMDVNDRSNVAGAA